MAITTAKVTYRVRVADAGAATVSGNVAYTLALSADMENPPLMSGATVDPLAGTLVRSPFSVRCISDAVLTTSSGRLDGIGRLIEIQRSTDDGAVWTTLGTGRISRMAEPDGRGLIDVEVSDQSWTGKRARLFKTTTSVQLHPPGLASAFMDFPAAGSDTYTVTEVSGNAVRIEANRRATPTKDYRIPRSMRNALRADLFDTQDLDTTNSNSDGNFTGLRFDLDSGGPTPGDRTVLSFASNLGGLVNPSIVLGDLKPSGGGELRPAWIYAGSGHGLSEDDEIVGRFYFVTPIRTSENVPVHIGGTGGIHPMTLAKDILDGDYGGDGLTYNSAAVTALEALPFQKVWLRTWGQDVERPDWLSENVWQIYAVAPMVGTDLAIHPSSVALPQNVSLGSLATIGADDGDRLMWSHESRDAVNVIEFSSRVIDEITETGERGDDWPVDGLVGTMERFFPDFEHGTVSTLGEIPRKYETELSVAKGVGLGGGHDVAQALSRAVFHVFGDGPQVGAIQTAENAGHEPGDLVLLDHDTLEGFNAENGDRTGDRLVRLLAFRQMDLATNEYDYLDMGPGNVALSAPSGTITQDGTDPDLVNVAISGLSAGETAVVQCTAAASTPSEYDFVRAGVGNETIQFRLGASSGNAYARFKATAPGRIESAWATDSVALSARAKITRGKVVRTTLGDFEATWEVPSGTGGMKTDYSIHNRLEKATFGSNEQDYDATDGGFSVVGAMRSTREMVTVRLIPYPGFSAGSVSGTAGELLETSAIFIKVGGGPTPDRRDILRFAISFNADGEVVVNAQGDSEAAAIYVTVGDGTSPADPTSSVNDGEITGRDGIVNTGVSVAVGNDAYVKAVAADLAGNLGPVVEERRDRRVGQIHKLGGLRSTAAATYTSLQRIVVPADVLGENGGVRVTGAFSIGGTANTKQIDVVWDGATHFTITIPAAYVGTAWIEFLLFNDSDTAVQESSCKYNDETPTIDIQSASDTADTTAAVDLYIYAQTANALDNVSLVNSSAVLLPPP